MTVRNIRGITLVELLVSISIAMLVLGAVLHSFMAILKPQVQETEISRKQITTGIALEMVRKDIEMAGFGLPWDTKSQNYSEAANDNSYTPDPATFNDAPTGNPRPLVFSDNGNTNASNSDVLVIKSTVATWSNEAMQWGYLFNDAGSVRYQPLSPQTGTTGYFVVLNLDRSLLGFHYQDSTFPCPDEGHVYPAYGLTESSTQRMPFNRVDYYLKQPQDNFPKKCVTSSYILYRSTIGHSNGKRVEQPLLSCVKDFQVAFVLDTNKDGIADSWISTEDAYPNSAEDIRNQVVEVRVFILYQASQKDKSYLYPLDMCADNSKGIAIKDSDIGELKCVHLSDEERHYRWEVIKLVVNPLNLRKMAR